MTPAQTIAESVEVANLQTARLAPLLGISKRKLDDWIARGRADADRRPHDSRYAEPDSEDALKVLAALYVVIGDTRERLRQIGDRASRKEKETP